MDRETVNRAFEICGDFMCQ